MKICVVKLFLKISEWRNMTMAKRRFGFAYAYYYFYFYFNKVRAICDAKNGFMPKACLNF